MLESKKLKNDDSDMLLRCQLKKTKIMILVDDDVDDDQNTMFVHN